MATSWYAFTLCNPASLSQSCNTKNTRDIDTARRKTTSNNTAGASSGSTPTHIPTPDATRLPPTLENSTRPTRTSLRLSDLPPSPPGAGGSGLEDTPEQGRVDKGKGRARHPVLHHQPQGQTRHHRILRRNAKSVACDWCPDDAWLLSFRRTL